MFTYRKLYSQHISNKFISLSRLLTLELYLRFKQGLNIGDYLALTRVSFTFVHVLLMN